MSKRLKIAAPEAKIQEPVKVVFGFSELRQCSYINAINDGRFFLRATGDNHSFLGYRTEDVFQILFIEYQFGDIYQH